MKYFIALLVGLVLGAGGCLYVNGAFEDTLAHTFGSATSLCDVTAATVPIGAQAATTLVTAGSYQWVTVEQPVSATNTVSLSIGGTAVAGQGYLLTPATTSSPVTTLTVGFGPNLPFRGAITARTNTGSSTINVLSCK